MIPWFWFWSPQFHFPFGGNLVQDIAPATDWFFGSIRPAAGDGATEQQIHEGIASYGRQLGLLTEVLLSMHGDPSIPPEQARDSVRRLQEIRREVEALKAREKPTLAESAAAVLDRLAREDPAACAQLVQRFAPPRPPTRRGAG